MPPAAAGGLRMTPLQEIWDRLGVGLSAVVAAAGWALTVVVLIRGGTLEQVAVNLAPALPVAVIATVTALAAWRRSVNIAVWLGVVVATAALVNLVLFIFVVGSGIWPYILPPADWGADFRDGLYVPAQAFSVAGSGWPPLTLLLGWPFTLVGFSTAFAVQVALIACAAVGSAVLSAVLAVRMLPEGVSRHAGLGHGPVDVQSLGIVFGVWLLTSYGFMYELWRGNVDLYALVFCLLAVWATIELPRSPWWPAVSLAVAINLKLYPAILLALLFWRYRLRAVVPVLVTNAILLMIAGPVNFWRLVTWLTKMTPGTRNGAFGDMGVAATAAKLRETTTWAPHWVGVPLFVVPVALWTITAFVLMRRGWSDERAVLLAASSVPPMAVLPTLSNDYKLVLFVFPLAVLAATVAGSGLRRTRLAWCLSFGVVAWLLVYVARTTAAHMGGELIGSKYSIAILVQVVLLAVALWQGRAHAAEAGAETEGVAT
jgi:hypothetical protein